MRCKKGKKKVIVARTILEEDQDMDARFDTRVYG